MSEMINKHSDKDTKPDRICNSDTIITVVLTCSIFMVVFAVVLRPTSDGSGGGGYDPGDMLAKKVEKLEERIDAISKALEEEDKNCVKVTGSSLHKDDIPADCAEIYDRGVRQDGVYLISPDGRCPYRVYCDMDNGGWTLIQRHADGKVNFYRPWNDYVTGFGKLEGDHWLGLDKIHRLTKAGSQVYFHIEKYDGSFKYAHYQAFTVHDVTTAYRMNMDNFGYQGTLKELLSNHNNMKFSTFDRDNDKHGDNCCASHGGGGWWWNKCYTFNPNGIFGKQARGGMAYYDGGVIPVKKFFIKVKRRQGLC